jgi:hypothetical protein
MKWIHILLIIGTLLACSSGIASAANDTDSFGSIINMGEVKNSAAGFWSTTNETNNVGYLILGICAIWWLVSVMGMLLYGGGAKAVGGASGTNDNNQVAKGDAIIAGAMKAGIYVPIAIIVVGVFIGLI